MNIKHVVNISGGKDSQAVAILAKRWAEKHDRIDDFTFVFADTGHEAQLTYEHIDYIEEWMGIPILRVKKTFTQKQFDTTIRSRKKKWIGISGYEARMRNLNHFMKPTGNPMTDLSMSRGGFPSYKERFCTDRLKIKPIYDQVERPLLDQGFGIIKHLGVRKDESVKRAKTPAFIRDSSDFRVMNWYPIRHWGVEDVFEFIAEAGMKVNSLYHQGFTRVGCFPCIFAKKGEIANIAKNFPEEIARVEEMEDIVNKVSKIDNSSFLGIKTDKQRQAYRMTGKVPGINDIVDWSLGIIPGQADLFNEELLDIAEKDECSVQGYCND